MAKESFGARLRSSRIAKGMTGKELARALGVQANFLYCVERGEKRLSLDKVVRAATVLTVEVGWLIDGGKSTRKKK